MKKFLSGYLVQLLLTCITVIIIRQLDWLPWWSFVVPVLLLGILFALNGNPRAGFSIGFLAGFTVWLGGIFFYEQLYGGSVLARTGLLLSVPPVIVLIISGTMGGLLTGLALYAGKTLLVIEKNTSQRDKQKL